MVDNGSTDGTANVVQKLEDPRLKYIRNPLPTKSCEAPRDLGIQLAKGSLISFLDDDDRWYSEKLEKTRRIFEEHPYVSLVCHNQNMIVNGKFKGTLKCGENGDNVYETLLYERSCIFPSATTIKAGILKEFNGFSVRQEFYAAGDYDLWLRMARENVKMYFMDEALGECLITGENGSVGNAAFAARLTSLLEEHILDYERKPIFQISKKGMRRLFQLNYFTARTCLKALKFNYAVRHYYKAAQFAILRPTLFFNLSAKLKRVTE